MSGFTTDTFPSVLGGGIPGGQPKGGLLGGGSGGRFSGTGIEGGGARELERVTLRRVLGFTLFPGQTANSSLPITPFRRYFNAGDTAGTVNSATSAQLGRPPNQVGSSSMVSRLRTSYNGINNQGEAFFTGNPKYVYDASNYVRFKKLQAVNRNYNDSSYGGSSASSVATALARVRR
jgi:hypothetical protein